MTVSRARLVLGGDGERTRVLRAAATAPQRWTAAPREGGRWIDAFHQVLGDGIFAGDRLHTSVDAGGGVTAVVRGIAATGLRPGRPSLAMTRMAVRDGARLLYLPGAMMPFAGANHTASLSLDARRGGCVLAMAVLLPGRSGRGERCAFERLRLRTTARLDGEVLFAEDTLIQGDQWLDGPAGFAGAGAVVSGVVLGRWPLADPAWWRELRLPPEMIGGASGLAEACAVFRGLCASLGVAQQFLEDLTRCAISAGAGTQL